MNTRATAINLSASLAALEKKVLLIDIDPQGSLTAAAGVGTAAGESLAEVLGGGEPGHLSLADILVDVSEDDTAVLHLAPADIQLSPNELGMTQRMGRENILHRALATVDGRYDVCLIDCPPSLGILTVNALRAATVVLIPTQPQISDLRGLSLFLDTVDGIRAEINPRLEIMGILVTFYDGRLIHHQDAVTVLQERGLPLFETRIGRSVRVAEAPAAGESVVTYDPDNPQAGNYRQLADEVDEWLRKEQR
jgi:chromosome partitioning protein